MKLYIECNMGIAGDMLTAALTELFDDRDGIVRELNEIGIEGVSFKASAAEKCGIKGTHMTVLYNGQEESEEMHDHHEHDHHDHDHHEHGHHDHHGHHHRHASLADVKSIIGSLDVPDNVRKNACRVYDALAEAEAHVHGTDIGNIHFHEVGTMDAVADITAVCYLISKLNPEKITVSPIHVGRGTVRCAHGILPVPAPATAYLLKDVPVYSRDNIEGELCTPTGAALVKCFADSFGWMPVMKIQKTGYGLGTKDFSIANAVRVFLYEDESEAEKVVELDTNIDDMTGEEIGYAAGALFEAGALEVFTTAVNMKKNRPGILLTVLCRNEQKDQIIRAIFRNTTTLGVRVSLKDRYFMKREIIEEQTEFGVIRKKVSSGFGSVRKKYEYEDLEAVSRKSGDSLLELKEKLK